ncbi:MAG: hypothetical protein GPJ54_20155 [Candidatus Heimdallarchaeota archaeon]|nr:hypothetical protein [Candidatus Heimdallarchaeota archaeon]
MLNRINKEKFLKGVKYSVITELVLLIVFTIIYLFLFRDEGFYPFLVFTLFSGGLFFLISGFIGPGRFQHDFKIFIFSPKIGASYYENIPISSVCVDGVNQADIIVNGNNVGDLEYKNNTNQIMVRRDSIKDVGLNKMWLKSKKDGFLSNIVSFTFFDFDESMSVEQVDEFSSFDNQMDPLGLQQLNKEYQKKLSSHMGSLSLGFFFFGVLVMLIGVIFEQIYSL